MEFKVFNYRVFLSSCFCRINRNIMEFKVKQFAKLIMNVGYGINRNIMEFKAEKPNPLQSDRKKN